MPRVTTSIKHGGGSITFVNMKFIGTQSLGFDRCHLCGEQIKPGKGMYVVIPNKQQFPNCRVHEECTKPNAPFDKNHPLVWTAGKLHELWKEAQNYKHWFVD